MDYYEKYVKYKTKYINQTKCLDMHDWINKYKNKHLTIKTLKKWKIGETKDVVIFDRNFDEHGINELEKQKCYKPDVFFKNNRVKVKYNGDLTWEIHSWERFCTNVELDVTSLNTNCMWDMIKDKHIVYGNKKKHWTKFDDNTRIGWRGPMMLWTDVKKGIKVFYKDYV